MPIASTDILRKLSVKTGSAGNSTAQTDPGESLGKYISTTLLGSTTLNGDINAAVTTVVVTAYASFPASGNFKIQIDGEIMLVTAGQGTASWTVTRAQDSTTAASHSNGATVAQVLFDPVSGAENAASDVEYRCIFLHNAHATLTWITPVAWISAEVANGASVALGVDTTAASAIGSASAQAIEVANESSAPGGVSFSSPTSKGTGLSLSSIPAGQCKALWIRRTAANNAALAGDGFTLSVEGDTDA